MSETRAIYLALGKIIYKMAKLETGTDGDKEPEESMDEPEASEYMHLKQQRDTALRDLLKLGE